MASLSCIGEFPDLVKNVFLTEATNDQNAIAVRFFIRGKPWVLTIDEKLLFVGSSNPYLKFSKRSADGNALWAALLEKAWAKMKGNYLIAEGGLAENGMHYLTGIPVIRYYTT